jgi:hypothetical protein
MINKFCKCFNFKDIVLVWVLILTPISIAEILAKAGSSIYERIFIKHGQPVQLRLSPDVFRPCESFNCNRNYCNIHQGATTGMSKI